MSLTIQQYEQYKQKLTDIQRDVVTLEAKKAQLEEHLMTTFGLTPAQAEAELAKLEVELPVMEQDFEKKYNEFIAKFGQELNQ